MSIIKKIAHWADKFSTGMLSIICKCRSSILNLPVAFSQVREFKLGAAGRIT